MTDSKHMPAGLLMQPLNASILSLSAVTGFSLLLGAFFLPAEARRLNPTQHSSVTHVLVPEAGEDSVALFWTIPKEGQPGWRHHLAVAGIERQVVDENRQAPEPLALAAVPGTRQSIIGNWDGSLYLFHHERNNNTLTWLGRQPDGGVVDVACSGDGKYAVSLNAFSMYGWNLEERREQWRRNEMYASCLAIHPDGQRAIVGDARGDLVEIELATGVTKRLLAQMNSPPVTVSISPDAENMAVLVADGRLQLWNDDLQTIGWSMPIGWHVAAGRFLAFSADGRKLATTNPENPCGLAVWHVDERRQVGTLVGHEDVVLGGAFAPDGTLWSWGADGAVRTWDVASGRAVSVTVYAPQRQSPS